MLFASDIAFALALVFAPASASVLASAFAVALASAFASAKRQLEAPQVLLQVASFVYCTACSKEPMLVHSFCDLL